jgi:hypothetical protein
MSRYEADVQRFYELIAKLELKPHQCLTLRELIATRGLPARGVYFFREPGEYSSVFRGPRIVRVGTHGVSTGSKATLRSRLRMHLGTQSGGGNHRGSIFRRHVGHAILNEGKQSVSTWGVGSSAPTELRECPAALRTERELEHMVSERIGAMSVLWVHVPDEASASSERATIERNAIAMLSNKKQLVERAGTGWLGHHSDRQEIRSSLLWNLNHTADTYDPSFLPILQAAIERT